MSLTTKAAVAWLVFVLACGGFVALFVYAVARALIDGFAF